MPTLNVQCELLAEALGRQGALRMHSNERDTSDGNGDVVDSRFQLFFENAPLYCFMVSPQGIIENINTAALKALGYNRVELVGKHIRIIYAPECEEKIKLLFQSWKENGTPIDEELIIQTKDGEKRTVLLSANAIKDSKGNLIHSISIQKDITEQRKIERMLKEREEAIRLEMDRAQKYLDIAGVLFIAVDTRGNITLVNKKTLEVFGYTEEEMLGQNYFDLCIPERLRLEMKKVFRKNIDGEIEPKTFVENPIITKDGAERYVSWHTTLLHDEMGTLVGALTAGEDISERKVAETALVIERDRAQKYLDMAGAAFVGINSSHRIFLVNRKGCEIFGYTEEELIGQNYFETCIPERLRKEMCRLFDLAMAGEYELSEYTENPILTKDGIERIIWWHTTILKDDKDQITGILSSGEDITEQKISEAGLKASEEKFRSLVEDTADWVWESDRNGLFTYSNSSVEDILGYTAGQILGRTLWEYMESSEIEKSENFFKENLRNQHSFKNLVNEFIHRDGNTIILETSGRPIIGDQGQAIGFRGFCRDITQRMLADSILRESEARYRGLVETSPDAITLTDQHGTVILVNNRTVNLLGYDSQEELIGQICFDFVVPEERNQAKQDLEGTSEHGIPSPVPYTLIRKDQSTFPAEISTSLLTNVEGHPIGYILVMREISERKKAERELEEAKAQAEFFTDLMAHDLSNINQAILSALEIQLLDSKLSKKYRQQISLALEQVERSSALIGRVKKFSRIEGIESLLEVRDIEPDYNAALNTVKQAYPQKKIRVDTNIHPGKFNVLADGLLVDLFFNLLHNSVKFDRKDKVKIEVHVRPDTNRRFLRIEITDHGPGIPDDLKELIFARYTRRIGEKAQGSGIGLTLVQRIIGRYGGKIWVEDRVKGSHTKGAKIVFLLPVWN